MQLLQTRGQQPNIKFYFKTICFSTLAHLLYVDWVWLCLGVLLIRSIFYLFYFIFFYLM